MRIIDKEYESLVRELKSRVSYSKYKAALSVNQELVMLYHHIGARILDSQKNSWLGF